MKRVLKIGKTWWGSNIKIVWFCADTLIPHKWNMMIRKRLAIMYFFETIILLQIMHLNVLNKRD